MKCDVLRIAMYQRGEVADDLHGLLFKLHALNGVQEWRQKKKSSTYLVIVVRRSSTPGANGKGTFYETDNLCDLNDAGALPDDAERQVEWIVQPDLLKLILKKLATPVPEYH